MPKIVSPIPRYRRHSRRNCGFVQLRGRRTYSLGKFGPYESCTTERRLVPEWETNDRSILPPATSDLTIVESLARFCPPSVRTAWRETTSYTLTYLSRLPLTMREQSGLSTMLVIAPPCKFW